MRPRQFAHLDGHDAYDILGVAPKASRAQIDAARRALVKVLHPDLPDGDAARMSLVNSAADILMDADQRRDYDEYLADERKLRSSGRHGSRAERDRTDRTHTDRTHTDRTHTDRTYRARIPSENADRARADGTRSDDTRSDGTRTGGTRTDRVGTDRVRADRVRADRVRADRVRAERAYADGEAPRGPVRSGVPPRQREGDLPTARPPLKWQPPQPSRVARWRARRQFGKQLARGQRVSPSGGPVVVILFLVALISICAVGGALIGYTTQLGGGSTPTKSTPTRSTPAKSTPAKTGPAKSAPHKTTPAPSGSAAHKPAPHKSSAAPNASSHT